jgi:starch synthase
MADKKVLFVSQEITPYVPSTPMSDLGKAIPQYIQEHGYQIRTFLPKWGIINERRNQLHEVIRLSGMNIIINDTDHPLIIKVATLQSSHIQVYFIDNDDFFKKRQMAVDKDGNEYDDNYERAVFYARSVIETTKLLRWSPAIIQCQGWISALTPFYIKNAYADEPCFSGSKCVMTLHNQNLNEPLPDNYKDMLAFRSITPKKIDSFNLPLNTYKDYMKFCISFSDALVCADAHINPELVQFAKDKGIPVQDYCEDAFDEKIANFYHSLE